MADTHTGDVIVQTAVHGVPVTVDRPPYNPSFKDSVKLSATGEHLATHAPDHHSLLAMTPIHQGTARATKAATPSAPDGTPAWADAHAHETVLQQHCAFFDADSDGVIWPLDTFRGFRALGFNLVLCAFAVVIIHANFSYPTCPGLLPDPFFRLYVDNIHKAKHGSDTGTYDNEGRFVPQK